MLALRRQGNLLTFPSVANLLMFAMVQCRSPAASAVCRWNCSSMQRSSAQPDNTLVNTR